MSAPIPRPSLAEHVYAELKRDILRSVLQPGSVVIEAELAERFGYSKTPIREALRLLVRDGWIQVLPRRGYLVRPIGLDDVRQIYQFRSVLECAIVPLALPAIDESDLAALRSDIAAQAQAGKSLEDSIQASRRFHMRLAGLTSNRRMVVALESLVDEVERLLRMLPHLVTVMTSEEEIGAHTRLVDALATGDQAAAVREMDAHLRQISRTLVGALSGLDRNPPRSAARVTDI